MRILQDIYLVIGAKSKNVQHYLSAQLMTHGVNIVFCGCIDNQFVNQLENHPQVDVILIIINEIDEEDNPAFDCLLDKTDIPILFYEQNSNEMFDCTKRYGFSQLIIKKLAKKLKTLSQNSNKKKASVKKNNSKNLSEKIAYKKVAYNAKNLHNKVKNRVKNVWVLGASLGGTEATKHFLEKIPGELPVAFVLAQHLGDGFIGLFANQINKVCSFKVKEGMDGDILHHGEVAIVPVDRQMLIDASGNIKLIDNAWQGHYNPSINAVINNVTQTFKNHSGVIIFTGMGEDGSLACQEFHKRNTGTIWAQSKASCVMSSMPDAVRKVNIVSYSGSPEALALKMIKKYNS